MLSLEEWLVLLVIFVTNVIQAVTGFAGTVLAMPFTIRLIGETEAKAVLDMVALAVCVLVVIFHYKSIRIRDFLPMFLFTAIGFGIGFALELLPHDGTVFLKIYGSLIMALAAVFFFVDFEKVTLPDWLLYLILVGGGILHKLYVSGGPLVVIYASVRFKDKDEFRANLSLMWILLNLTMFTQYYLAGDYTESAWILLGLGSAVSLASFFLGRFVAKKLPLKIFMKVTYVLLLISGLMIVV